MNNILYVKADEYSLTCEDVYEEATCTLTFSGPEPNAHICYDLHEKSRRRYTPVSTSVPELQILCFKSMYIPQHQFNYTIDAIKYRDEVIMADPDVVKQPPMIHVLNEISSTHKKDVDDLLKYSFDHIKYDIEYPLKRDDPRTKYLMAISGHLLKDYSTKFTGPIQDRRIIFNNSSLANYWLWRIDQIKDRFLRWAIQGIQQTRKGFNVTYYNYDIELKGDILVDEAGLNKILATYRLFSKPHRLFTVSSLCSVMQNYNNNIEMIDKLRDYPYINVLEDLHRKIIIADDLSDLGSKRCTGVDLEEWRTAMVYFFRGYGITEETRKTIHCSMSHYRVKERLVVLECVCHTAEICIRHSNPIPLPSDPTPSMKYIHRMLYGDNKFMPRVEYIDALLRGDSSQFRFEYTHKIVCRAEDILDSDSPAEIVCPYNSIDPRYALLT